MENETPICACEALFMGYKKVRVKNPDTKMLENKIEVKFILNPVDAHDKLVQTDLGDVLKLYVTKLDIGL